jgi:hypothetical protein
MARLAEIWLAAPDRNSVTAAVNELEAILGRTPLQVGESRGPETRIVIVRPLAAVYEVRERDRLVQILSIIRVPSRER